MRWNPNTIKTIKEGYHGEGAKKTSTRKANEGAWLGAKTGNGRVELTPCRSVSNLRLCGKPAEKRKS